MDSVSLEQARQVVRGALAHGGELGLAPLTVAVLDPGGHLVLLERQDGSGLLRPQIAVAKAWGVLGMGLPVKGFLERAQAMPGFFGTLATLADGRIVPVAGGVPIKGPGRSPLGAVGITGDTSENDERCAVAGIRAAGLEPWLE